MAVGETEVGDTVVAVKDADGGDTKTFIVDAEAEDAIETASEATAASDDVVVVSS